MPTSARQQDQNGYLLIKQCPIASFGIFQYSAAQLGLDGDPNRIVNVYRPEESVNDPEYLASFDVVPLINDHEMLSGFQGDDSATAPEEYGTDGVLFNVGYGAPWVTGDLKIFSRSMQADLNAGKKDLSLGYTCDFDMKSGTFNGTPYEVVQTNMRGNHIALVDVGRVPGARVLDGRKLCFDHLDISFTPTIGVNDMPKGRKTGDSTVETLKAQLKALLPTFEQFLNEEATEPAHQAGAGGAEGAQAGAENAGAAAEGAAANAEGAGAGGAADPAAADPANGGESQGEGENDGAEGAGAGEQPMNINEAISQLESILSQLKAAQGGGEAGDGEGEGMGGEGEGENANDTTEGLEGTAREGEDGEGEGGAALGEGGQGRASQGPAAGEHKGTDAALRSLYADAAAKTRFYERVSRVVGAFDGKLDIASATCADVVAYGVKALKIQCGKTPQEQRIALDACLNGIERARQINTTTATQKAAKDSAEKAVPVIDAYFGKE